MTRASPLVLLVLAACSGDRPAAPTQPTIEAVETGVAECAACGMVVREQPAPRGQVVHRDGHRAHFCSIGDMVQYLRAPSPHGKVQAAFVELLEPAADPKRTDRATRPWSAAEEASYVVGVHRDGIMGPPVLTYADPSAAGEVARKHGGAVRTWQALQDLSAAPNPAH